MGVCVGSHRCLCLCEYVYHSHVCICVFTYMCMYASVFLAFKKLHLFAVTLIEDSLTCVMVVRKYSNKTIDNVISIQLIGYCIVLCVG